ncbi:RidA family protein [Aquimarina sp. U1-2]|uniref:RidA family protein n=1 Tax=Aquimarina sp. U1-2 TaxID=2823141 RepID=UPI001AECD45C|nr:RidA family protein [Aquimarina sp. U1-2]MBP2832177.1 RidA family protein [Aquimarina sp. U1-2]
MKNILCILCFALVIQACQTDTRTIIFHKTHEPKKSAAPFSDIVQVDDLYFLSGQIGMDHSTRKLVEGGIKAETKQTLENIKAVLKHHNLEMKHVVKCTVILSDIEDFATCNAVYRTYFPQKPARTTFAAKDLAMGATIEIECIAVKP